MGTIKIYQYQKDFAVWYQATIGDTILASADLRELTERIQSNFPDRRIEYMFPGY